MFKYKLFCQLSSPEERQDRTDRIGYSIRDRIRLRSVVRGDEGNINPERLRRLCEKIFCPSNIFQCLTISFQDGVMERSNPTGKYLMTEYFYTPDPQEFAQELSRKLIELAETDKEVKDLLPQLGDISLQRQASMTSWSVYCWRDHWSDYLSKCKG